MEDKFLKVMNELLNRWKGEKEERFIIDQNIKFPPCLINLILKHEEKVEISARNGGLILCPTSPHLEAGVRATIAIGDLDKRGNGLGIFSSVGAAPFRGRGLKASLDELIDEALKQALAEYFSHQAYISRHEKGKRFDRLSKEEPVNHIDDEKKFDIDIESLSLCIEEASRFLYQIKEVESTEIDSGFLKENRRFVSLDRVSGKELRSNIFTSQLRGYINFSIEIRDRNSRLIEFVERLAGTDIGKIANKKNIMAKARRLAAIAKEMSKGEVQESGLYKAVFDARAVAVLLHEAGVGHLLSARLIDGVDGEQATTFERKIGQKVLPEIITIIDDPTIPGAFGSFKYDEEGVPAQRTVLIENGVLRNYLHNRITAGRREMKSNGKSRAESVLEPEPRITNLVIEPSISYSTEELIKMMIKDCKRDGDEYGLYIEGGGGYVSPDTGQFILLPNTCYRIYTDGRKVPVTSIFIPQEPYQAFYSIEAMGNKRRVFQSFCGASSGLVCTEERSVPAYVITEVHSIGGDTPRKRLKEKIEIEKDEDEE